MKWFFPSWNGDVRIESHPDNDKATRITVISPTEAELAGLKLLEREFRDKRWLAKDVLLWDESKAGYRKSAEQVTVLSAPIGKVAPLCVERFKPGKQTLSAVVLKDGRVETVQGGETGDLVKLAAKAEKEGEAAASVKRPTPSCPQCHVGAVEPATEVLLSFLTEEQHETWASDRFIQVVGGLSGAHYVLAHRRSALAARIGKICFDLDHRYVLHFHDNSVPPEEEVLAAKLILEHREHWLRNEATLLTHVPVGDRVRFTGDDPKRFKNPFGGGQDGVVDSAFTESIGTYGELLAHALGRA